MITAALASLLACAAPASPLLPPATSSFLLEQPEASIPESFSGFDEPLYGQTPPLRFVHYGSAADQVDILRRIRYARDYYRHAGLLISVEERLYVLDGADRGTAESRLRELGLFEPGRTIMFSTGTLLDELSRVLGAGEPAAMIKD